MMSSNTTAFTHLSHTHLIYFLNCSNVPYAKTLLKETQMLQTKRVFIMLKPLYSSILLILFYAIDQMNESLNKSAFNYKWSEKAIC